MERQSGQASRTRSGVVATVSLACTLRIRAAADGADAQDQSETVTGTGCAEIQGYCFPRPVDEQVLRHWVPDFLLFFHIPGPVFGSSGDHPV